MDFSIVPATGIFSAAADREVMVLRMNLLAPKPQALTVPYAVHIAHLIEQLVPFPGIVAVQADLRSTAQVGLPVNGDRTTGDKPQVV